MKFAIQKSTQCVTIVIHLKIWQAGLNINYKLSVVYGHQNIHPKVGKLT